MEVCTIIAKNYVAHARVLARSLAERQAGARLWTLIIDDFAGYIDPAEEPFAVLTPDEIGCEPFTHMALRYSVLELSTAVKPWLLRYLMAQTGKPVTYLDPDIKVYGSLEQLDQLAAEHGVVLIPHNSEPIPPDGRKPGQVDIMIAGIYNLGYVSLASRPEVRQLLDWWADRLRRDCRVDPIWGYFVDQRWFDLAPGFLTDLAIVRDPQYNVAYWNLHSRRLERSGELYLAGGRPLAFFHFSGFDPARPLVLSRHQNRIDVLEHPVLEQLLAEYAGDVIAEGHAVSRHWPYGYAVLGDGTQVDDTLRDLYDEYSEGRNGGVPSPFTLEGMRAFDRWLTERGPGAPAGVNRVLARVYKDRSDLRAAYPDLVADRAGLLRWAAEDGRHEVPALAREMTPAAAPLDAPRDRPATRLPEAPLRRAPWGVNVVGDFLSEREPDEIARRFVALLDRGGVTALPVASGTTTAAELRRYATAGPQEAPFPVNLICVDPELLPAYLREAGPGFFAGRYSIGLWPAHCSRPLERERETASLIEEIWVPSAHAAATLEQLGTVPVSTVRIPVAPVVPEARTRADFGLGDEPFSFLFRLDYRAMFARKNPLAVIEAFGRAFAPGEGAVLILKCSHADRNRAAHAELLASAAEHRDIHVLDRPLAPRDGASLTALSDCYVSLHRAEAFGVEMADAMWLGKPVIATGYSGNLDYMTDSNSYLVDHRLVSIGPGHEPYLAEGLWAQPDVEHAARLMRQVFEDREGARAVASIAAQDIRRTHGPEVTGEIVERRLESIRGTGRARRGADPVRERPSAGAMLALMVRRGLPQGARGRGGRARELARKALLRAIRPYTAYQQAINIEMVGAVDELSRRVDELREDAAAERAYRMAELRKLERSAR